MAKPNSLKQLELDAVEEASLRLSAEALHWLLSASSNPAVQSIVMESIGRATYGSSGRRSSVGVEDIFCDSPSIVDVQGNLLSSLTEWHTIDGVPYPISGISLGMERKFERLLRSRMFISGVNKPWGVIDVPDQLVQTEFGATLITQIPKLCLFPEDLKLCKPNVFSPQYSIP